MAEIKRAESKKTEMAGAMGLDEQEVLASRREHGANILTKKKQKGFWGHFFSNLGDPVIRILLSALAVNLLLIFQGSDWVETVGIAVAVFLATLISTLSEHGSARAFERLSEQSANVDCRVRRNGIVRHVPLSEIVVGDVVLLSAGEMIPADGLLFSGEVRVDQSSMTGESKEIRKIPSADQSLSPAAPSSLLRGCTVTSGSCEMWVKTVGDASFMGQISKEIQLQTRESPLKIRLTRLAKQISLLGYAAAVLVALAYLFNVFVLDSGMQREMILWKMRDVPYLLSHLFHAFTLGLTVVVVAVPEGLPMMIAVVLSSNIRRMVRDHVLVRKPVGIEAAGSMNILFTDKTGTLTQGKMTVTSCLSVGREERSFSSVIHRETSLSHLLTLAFYYGTEATAGLDADSKRVAMGGSATDRALLTSVLSLSRPSVKIHSRLCFDSKRKYSAVTLEDKERMTLVLGAPERLLPHATDAIDEDGGMTAFSRRQIERAISEKTVKGERVLAVALSKECIDASRFEEGIFGSLTFIGAVCLSDPLRPEASKSVAELQDAGIQVVMITGDHRETARTLAKRCGILNAQHDLILTGEEMAVLSDLQMKECLPRLAVVARALPTDKSRLVRLAQEMDLVCGMTGDGINDAPALRRADIGFSMGAGTQVAKDAGDIIILDNNLSSIVRAVLYGRNIFKSIRKFITLQLIMNFCAVCVTVICPFLGIDAPVTVVQMLWINIIMDTLGGLAFAGEAPLPSSMKERPKKRDEPILNRYMVNEILLLGSFTVALCLFFLKSPTVTALFRPHENNLYLMTAFFALFIFTSVFNCFNARTDRLDLFAGLGKNPIFLLIMGAILVIQLLFVYLGGSVLRTAPLAVSELLPTMLISLSVFPAELIRKALWRLRKRRSGY